MGGTMGGYLSTLRLCCGRLPSFVCFAATFPPGEGFFEWYHLSKLYHVNRAFPEGEGGPGVSPGRMRATYRTESVVY